MSGTLRILIELSDGYRPTDRLAAAISELDEALAEAHGDDTAGFAADVVPLGQRSFAAAAWQVQGAGSLERRIVQEPRFRAPGEWFAELYVVDPGAVT